MVRTSTHTSDGHLRELTVRRNQDGGWDVREELDREVVREVNYRDWHRVERFMHMFELPEAFHSTNR